MTENNEAQARILNVENSLEALALKRKKLGKELSKKGSTKQILSAEIRKINLEISRHEMLVRRLRGERSEGKNKAGKDTRRQKQAREQAKKKEINRKIIALSIKERQAKRKAELPSLREVALPDGERTHFAKAFEKGGYEGHTLCGIRLPANPYTTSTPHQVCQRCELQLDRMYKL